MNSRTILATLVIISTFMFAACGGSGSSDTSSVFGGDGSGEGGTGGDGTGNNSILLSWQAPITNEDGTHLIDLAGYRVYYGTSVVTLDKQINIVGFTSCDVSDLSTGMTYYFAVTAYDTSGNESVYSNIKSTIIN